MNGWLVLVLFIAVAAVGASTALDRLLPRDHCVTSSNVGASVQICVSDKRFNELLAIEKQRH